MAILSIGTALTDDVESGLHLTEIVDSASPDGAMIMFVVGAAESHIKHETGRNFEQTVFLDQAYDVRPNTTDLPLTDRPVISIESIAEVVGRDEAGAITTRTLSAGEYVVDKATGIVSKLSGSFLSGKQALLVSWTAGYTAEQMQSGATNEIKVLKQLCLSLAEHWHKKRKDGVGHYDTASAPGESVSINFDFTLDEKRMLDRLRI